MTYEQYKIIMDCYLDFYPDDRIDVVPYPVLQELMDMEEDEDRDEEAYKSCLDNIEMRVANTLTITVYHPEITITNEYGNSYTLKDVYVQTIFPQMVISLARTTFTSDEISNGYIHSHVPKGGFTEMQMFCTGSGTINRIKDRIENMGNESTEDFKNAITSFIIDTERMIRVESLAGGPYILFANIGKKVESIPITIPIAHPYSMGYSKAYHKFVDFIKYYCSLGLDEFYYDGRNWQLKATDAEFIRRVTRVARTYKKTSNVNSAGIYQWVYEMDGLYYQPNAMNRGYRLGGNTTSWLWKGEHLPINVSSNLAYVKGVYIVNTDYLEILYTFLLELINGTYVNGEKYKDCIQSRAYKVKTALINAM